MDSESDEAEQVTRRRGNWVTDANINRVSVSPDHLVTPEATAEGRTQSPFRIVDEIIHPGESRNLTFKISESYCGTPVNIPLRVIRGTRPGPAIFVTGAIHGDELNGAGIIRQFITEFQHIDVGTVILVPVVNMLGLERHSRYMPDRRDLNRCFPGSPHGSLSSRLAHVIFSEIIQKCDYGIDLHSAAHFRTNIPNVRADLHEPRLRPIAEAFGCRLIVNNTGPRGSLRQAATKAGIPTIILEAGEVWRIEPDVVEVGVRGIRNVLIALNMMEPVENFSTGDGVTRQDDRATSPRGDKQTDAAERGVTMSLGRRVRPSTPVVSNKSVWIRAAQAGLLDSHITPGDWVEPGTPVATTTSLLGEQWSVLRSHVRGIVIGMTTLPSVKPGDPVCHIALPED